MREKKCREKERKIDEEEEEEEDEKNGRESLNFQRKLEIPPVTKSIFTILPDPSLHLPLSNIEDKSGYSTVYCIEIKFYLTYIFLEKQFQFKYVFSPYFI